MQGYFVVSRNSKNQKDILCELHPQYAQDEVPEDQSNLYVEVENANAIINSLINTPEKNKNKYFEKLLSLAQAGLVGNTANPKLAMLSLEKLKEEIIINEGARVKNRYMSKLGLCALGFSIAAIIINCIMEKMLGYKGMRLYLYTWIGSICGTWISFGARKFNIGFNELSIIEDDMLTPVLRLIYIGMCSCIVLVFLDCGIVSIKISSIDTAQIKSNTELQFVVGVMSGLVESKLGLQIYKKFSDFIDIKKSN